MSFSVDGEPGRRIHTGSNHSSHSVSQLSPCRCKGHIAVPVTASLVVPGGAGRTCYEEDPGFHDPLTRSGPSRQDKRQFVPDPTVGDSCSQGMGHRKCGNRAGDERLGSF